MPKLEDIRYSGNPLRQRNRIEEALMPALNKPEPPQSQPGPAPKPGLWRLKIAAIGALGLVVVVAFAIGSFLIYRQYRSAKALTPETTLESVGKLMALPDDEEPTIATVNDLAPLKGEPFFRDAEIGDKVLIYSAAKKAILYRPATDRIIIVAPIR